MKSDAGIPGINRALHRHVAVIGKFPMLEAQEEQELARRWRDRSDQAALDRMVTRHLRQVARIARLFAGYGMPVADLISVGAIGLMRAAHNYDPDLGFRFSTYAAWWIRAEMQQFVLDNWSLVRISRDAANKRLFFKLRRLKAELKIIDEGDLDPETAERIARKLKVPRRAVAEMNARLSGGELSLNVAFGETGEEWQDSLADERQDPEARLGEKEELTERRHRLGKALATLSERERAIVVERRISERRNTLDSLSVQFGISRERVRQIEARALEKLKASVSRATARPE